MLTLLGEPGVIDTIRTDGPRDVDFSDFLNLPGIERSGQFWDVYIPSNGAYVIKLARSPSDEFYAIVKSDYQLLNKFVPDFLPKQWCFKIRQDILLIQERVDFSFQISSASFDRKFSKDQILLRISLMLDHHFRGRFKKFIAGIRAMHTSTGKIIDLWGSGNVVFNIRELHRSPMLIDTNFLFSAVPADDTGSAHARKYMAIGYTKSLECLSKLEKLV